MVDSQALPKQQCDSPQPPKNDLEEQVAAAEVSVDLHALMESREETHTYDCGPLTHQVAQELQVLQASELTLATKLQPMLTKEGYSTTPSFFTLLAMGPEELCAITGFKVHRVNAGSLEWLVPVDLRGANLDCVDISRTGVSLDKSQLPMLDCPCQVVAEQVFPKPSASEEKALHFAKKLRARVENSGHGFQSYDAESGVLMFQVEHFSRVSTELHPN